MEEYYKLTDEDREIITKHFNNRDLEELLDFIDKGVNIVAGIVNRYYVTKLVEEYGAHVLFNSCENCAKSTSNCAPTFALEVCGEGLLEWEEKV